MEGSLIEDPVVDGVASKAVITAGVIHEEAFVLIEEAQVEVHVLLVHPKDVVHVEGDLPAKLHDPVVELLHGHKVLVAPVEPHKVLALK